MKEKSVTFCFLKLKAREKANFYKIFGEEGTFSVENVGPFFQNLCLLTKLPAEVLAAE